MGAGVNLPNVLKWWRVDTKRGEGELPRLEKSFRRAIDLQGGFQVFAKEVCRFFNHLGRGCMTYTVLKDMYKSVRALSLFVERLEFSVQLHVALRRHKRVLAAIHHQQGPRT